MIHLDREVLHSRGRGLARTGARRRELEHVAEQGRPFGEVRGAAIVSGMKGEIDSDRKTKVRRCFSQLIRFSSY